MLSTELKKKSITGKEEARNILHVPDDMYWRIGC